MLRASLVKVVSAAPRFLSATRSAGGRQLASQLRALSATPRTRRTQAASFGGGRTMAGYAGHDATFGNLTAQEAAEELQKGQCLYLDVRTPEEFAQGHPPGAANVPLMLMGGAGMQPNPDFLKTVEAKFSDKGINLVVGCKSGARSAAACDMMTKAGFSGLRNMLGGFTAWQGDGLPVEK